MATDIDVKGRGPTGRDSATADRTRIHRRRALLQTALAAASAFAASEAIRGSDTTSAATDFMKYGATNDAVGSTTVLKSAFVNGTNFTVETSISNGGVATSIKGRTTGFVSQGGTAFGVEGVTSAPGLATSIGVYGHSEGAAPTNVGVKGDATGPTSVGVLGTAASIGVEGTSAAGFALHGTSSASGVGLYARSEHGIGVHAEATSGSAIYAANEDASFVTIDAVQVEGGYSLRSQNQTHLVGDAKFSNRLYGEGPNAKFEGNGAGLTALHANSIATGTLASARTSPGSTQRPCRSRGR